MTHRMPITIVIVIGIIALATLLFFARSPVLYSFENTSAETKYHVNTGPLMAQPLNSTTDVYPLMQDLLNRPASITLDIRLRDPDSAIADFVAYEKTFGKLDNLVINLDMNQSEIKNFAMSTQAQDQILHQLANDTATLDSIKDLQIRFRSSQDPDIMISVNYQGAALQKRLSELYGRYLNEHQKVLPVSTKLGLDTTQYNQSTVEFQRILREADVFATGTGQLRTLASGGPYLSLAIEPDHAVYRDTISIVGHLVSSENDGNITLSMDGNPISNFTPDENGVYIGSFMVERIPAGTHSVVAKASNITSFPVLFTVTLVDSTTTLKARPDPRGHAATCSGTVLANRPIRYAPFTVRENNQTIFSGTTDGGGAFNVSVPLSAGTHILVARFDAPEYPVNISESKPVTVYISSSGFSLSYLRVPALLGVVTAILAASCGGAYLYLRRKKIIGPFMAKPTKKPAAIRKDQGDLLVLPGPEWSREAISHGTIPEDGNVLSRYEQARDAQGLSEAAYLAYRLLTGRIAGLRHIVRHLTRTPREIVHACRDAAYEAAVTRFVSAYERIRYAGGRSAGDQAEFRESLVQADETTGGGRD
jgi:hypothetical protein